MAHRLRTTTVSVLLAAAAAALTPGCGAGFGGGPAAEPPAGATTTATAPHPSARSTAPGTSAGPGPTAGATPDAPAATAATRTFTAADGGLRFEHPGSWTITETPGSPAGTGEPGTEIRVSDGSGRLLALLRTSVPGPSGESCEPLPYESFLAEPMQFVGDDPSDGPPVLVADAVGIPAAPSGAGGVRFTLSIHGTQPPHLGADRACNVQGRFRRSPATLYSAARPYAEFRAERRFTDLDDARAYLGTGEFALLADMMRSLEFAVVWS